MGAYRAPVDPTRPALPRGPLAKQYAELPSDELVEMILRRAGDYTEEALEVARTVLAVRGISIDAEQSRLDEEAARARESADEARRAREKVTDEISNAARALGTCAACREKPPQIELYAVAQRPLIGAGTPLPNAYLTSSEAVLLPLPLCASCEPAWRLPSPISWVKAAAFVLAVLLAEAALVALVPHGSLPADLMKLVLLAPMGAGVGIGLWLTSAANQRRRDAALRLARLHPAFERLQQAHTGLGEIGFAFLPPESLDRSKAAVLTGLLTDSDPRTRRAAEEQLRCCPGSDVVTALRACLDHPVAAAPAVRVLGALRARDAIGDLQRVAAEGPADAQEEARAVLNALG